MCYSILAFATPLIYFGKNTLSNLMGSLEKLGVPMKLILQDHKRGRYRISIQNFKVLDKCNLSLINPTLHSFRVNVGL